MATNTRQGLMITTASNLVSKTPKIRTKKIKVVKAISISMENEKVGKIPSFSVPAIDTCPGKTEWCGGEHGACYADKIQKRFPKAKASYLRNLIATDSPTFIQDMNLELAKLHFKGIRTFRYHIAGDFFSVKYIYQWVRLVKDNPEITFYGYTHSWSVPDLLPHIGVLRSQPNVVLFASVDESNTTKPPKHWKVAYAGDLQLNTYPKMVKCLEQEGKIASCETCKLCFNHKSTINIQFKVH